MNEQQRPNRAEEEKGERRRKRGSLQHTGVKLAVPEEHLDRANYEYRWINDDGARMAAMTQHDDWDIVHDPSKKVKDNATGEGTGISIIVGKREDGRPMRAFLARKRKDFYQDDQREKGERIMQTEQAIKDGKLHEASADAAELTTHGYTPEGRNTVQHSR